MRRGGRGDVRGHAGEGMLGVCAVGPARLPAAGALHVRKGLGRAEVVGGDGRGVVAAVRGTDPAGGRAHGGSVIDDGRRKGGVLCAAVGLHGHRRSLVLLSNMSERKYCA